MSGRAEVGDSCGECGRMKTELSAGGLIAYCWWCKDRAAGRFGVCVFP